MSEKQPKIRKCIRCRQDYDYSRRPWLKQCDDCVEAIEKQLVDLIHGCYLCKDCNQRISAPDKNYPGLCGACAYQAAARGS